jgi:hypothetical protein
MPKKAKNTISVTFISEVESITDKSEVRAAYTDLRKQIATFAEASAADPNIVISHSAINNLTGNPADSKIAELQTINARIEQNKTAITDPNYQSKFEPKGVEVEEAEETDPDEVPRVKAGPWPPPKSSSSPVPPPSPTPVVVDAALKGKMEVTIFSKLKKTEKSRAIIDYFLNNLDKEVSVDAIAKGTKIDNKSVSIWLSTTASKSVKAIKNVSRGVWMFDSTKVRVY